MRASLFVQQMGKPWFLLVLSPSILLVSLPISSIAAAKIYIISWKMHEYDVETGVTDFDFHYDEFADRGLLFSRLDEFGDSLFHFHWFDRVRGSSWGISYSIDSGLPRHIGIGASAYRQQSTTIYLARSSFDVFSSSIIQVDLGDIDNTEISYIELPLPEESQQTFETLDMVYNPTTDQLLYLIRDSQNSFSYIYSFETSLWTTAQSSSPYYSSNFGKLAVNPQDNEALYVNAMAEAQTQQNYTYVFDFDTLTWSNWYSGLMPIPTTQYELIYHPTIDQYVFLGGHISTPFGPVGNEGLWMYDPGLQEWFLIYKELPLFETLSSPVAYYEPKNDDLVLFGMEFDVFTIRSLNIEVVLEGFLVDFGMPLSTLLIGVGAFSGVILAIVLGYVMVNRKSIFTAN
ncbi:MAG: hypothetical protein ACW99A_15940 [Candidatus Kariarchaeaceae archaeon]|jgi:hypothetical protein